MRVKVSVQRTVVLVEVPPATIRARTARNVA
jgi:hypothetical protein